MAYPLVHADKTMRGPRATSGNPSEGREGRPRHERDPPPGEGRSAEVACRCDLRTWPNGPWPDDSRLEVGNPDVGNLEVGNPDVGNPDVGDLRAMLRGMRARSFQGSPGRG